MKALTKNFHYPKKGVVAFGHILGEMGEREGLHLSLSVISDVHLMPLGLSLLFILQVISEGACPITSKELPWIEREQYSRPFTLMEAASCISHLLLVIDQCNTLCLCFVHSYTTHRLACCPTEVSTLNHTHETIWGEGLAWV